MTTGLVRVVAKDGSVWWTRPEYVDSHAAIEDRYLNRPDTGYNEAYWRKKK